MRRILPVAQTGVKSFKSATFSENVVCSSNLNLIIFFLIILLAVRKSTDLTKMINKRPRGLDDLLGHLLIKRKPVMFQLSSTKVPEYLSQKINS